MDPEERARFLGPKPGEKLPDKEVSAKTMGRLQVAADAIAETKKAIPHQGNQVASLRTTKMNSQARLRVMRDQFAQPCWEYTNATSRTLANQNFEADLAAKADLAHGGNCGEHGFLAYHYLRLHAKGEKIQVSSSGTLDHQFAVLGDTKKEGPSDLVVADPWVNKPTACLWEDHFAYGPDLKIDHGGGVADGKSFKGAIAAGLKLTSFGAQMLKKAETEEETERQIAADDHVWNNEDSVAEDHKFNYTTPKAATQATKPQETTHGTQ